MRNEASPESVRSYCVNCGEFILFWGGKLCRTFCISIVIDFKLCHKAQSDYMMNESLVFMIHFLLAFLFFLFEWGELWHERVMILCFVCMVHDGY